MSGSRKYDVFISYRREGGLDCARTIFTELKRRGFRCFFDFKELKTGKFTDGIHQAVRNCRYFVLVLTDGALDRCITDSDDWVRKEIELALSLGKPIIPVCPSGNKRGFPEGLPETLSVLPSIQISQLARDDLFDASMNAIVRDRLSGSKIVSVRRRLPLLGVVSAILAIVSALGVVSWLHERAKTRAEEAERKARLVREQAELQTRRETAERERAEKQKREADAAARAAAEAAKAAEVARREAERKVKEAAERAAAEKIRLEAERLAAEKAKAEAEKAKAEAEARAKAEAQRIAKLEAERVAAEKAKAAAVERARREAEKAAAEKAKVEAERDKSAVESQNKKKMDVFDSF